MDKLLTRSKELQETLRSYREYLHQNAEIGLELPITTKYVMEKLTELGLKPKEICKSGIKVVLGKDTGKTFLLRADMDALPMKEEANIGIACQNGSMHACGHDLHASMLLGAAQLLKEHEDELDGQVVLMFQPAEELLIGAKTMIDAGILENPKVDAGMMIHVFTGMDIPSGVFLTLSAGTTTASSDWFTIEVQGRGCHGAMPEYGVDPLNVLAHTHIALQEILARELPPSATAVITVGQMHGGTTGNIIPDTGFLQGTIRTFSPEVRVFITKRLKEIAESVAKTFRAEAKVSLYNGCPNVLCDAKLRDYFIKATSELLGEDKVIDATTYMNGKYATLAGSEDFAFVSEKIPVIMVGLGAGSTQDGYTFSQHHPKAVFVDDYLYVGAAVYANTAIEWLKDK